MQCSSPSKHRTVERHEESRWAPTPFLLAPLQHAVYRDSIVLFNAVLQCVTMANHWGFSQEPWHSLCFVCAWFIPVKDKKRVVYKQRWANPRKVSRRNKLGVKHWIWILFRAGKEPGQKWGDTLERIISRRLKAVGAWSHRREQNRIPSSWEHHTRSKCRGLKPFHGCSCSEEMVLAVTFLRQLVSAGWDRTQGLQVTRPNAWAMNPQMSGKRNAIL